MLTPSIDLRKAKLANPDLFKRFRVPNRGVPLAESGLSPDTELLLVERSGARRALVLRQMAYHHVAQGELAGEPYVISF